MKQVCLHTSLRQHRMDSRWIQDDQPATAIISRKLGINLRRNGKKKFAQIHAYVINKVSLNLLTWKHFSACFCCHQLLINEKTVQRPGFFFPWIEKIYEYLPDKFTVLFKSLYISGVRSFFSPSIWKSSSHRRVHKDYAGQLSSF